MIRFVIFDWGNTVMREFDFGGKMVDAPHVEAMPGIAEALRRLRADGYRIVLASNAYPSGASDIRGALRRVGLDECFEFVFSSSEMGVSKPDPAFFKIVLDGCGCFPDEAVMVGDNFDKDVIGAKGAGLRAVWYNFRRDPLPDGVTVRADAEIHDLAELVSTITALNTP
jgi:putative hydrolase of the HAD superfamily